MPKFSFPFGLADLHIVKSKSPIVPQDNVTALSVSTDGGLTVYTDNETDTYYLRDGVQWFGLAMFTFCLKNRSHFRDYFIHDIRVSACPSGLYKEGYQELIKQLKATGERGKARVITIKLRALFEEELIESVIRRLLPRSDLMEILGAWQLQEKLFELGFKPVANAYRWGELRGS